MGREQDTVVSGSIIDLPLIADPADPADPRLPRAFKGWNQFSISHSQQLAKIGLLSFSELLSLAGELASTLGDTIGINPGTYKLGLSQEKVVKLTEVVFGEDNRVIFMRHGEQGPPGWIYSLSNPALRKIRMMQDPFNRQDLLTNNGLIDVFVTALALRHVQMVTGKRVKIFSSENLRAKEVTYVFSKIIPCGVKQSEAIINR